MSYADEQSRAREHLDELLALDSGLSDWEVNFIESVSHRDDNLTEKQINIIYEIYERHC
jgi:hypothetical protein